MLYQSDYILRTIEQMGALLRRALELIGSGGPEGSYELAEQALDVALDIDPETVDRLAPQSLVSLLELEAYDDRILTLVADALEIQAESLDSDGDLARAAFKRGQAEAVRHMYDPERAN